MNTIKDLLKTDLTAAMKARDVITVGTLRMALAAVMNAEVAGDAVAVLSDSQIIEVLQSEAKKRTEAADIYEKAGRTDSAAQERAEKEVLDRYLPAALSDADLVTIVNEEVGIAAQAGATGGKAMGLVVKAVRARTGSSADGSRIADLVKAALL
jgi:uncharacterized protein